MSYTIREEGLGEYTEKKSVFTGRICPCSSEAEARQYIEGIRKQERTARHHVFAYVIGEKNQIVRYSDDGEPQGTGGLPVLNVLTQHGLTDVCLVVSRFFGGILLGAPGLTRAYGKAAADAAASVTHWQVIQGAAFMVTLPYDLHARLKSFLSELQVTQTDFSQSVTLHLLTTEEEVDGVMAELTNQTQGQAIFSEVTAGRYFLSKDGMLEPVDQD
ncbi:YigZ family protein [Clostridiaceae bacterium HFYG-1003]|nr:YigZ family protein [Clostridiaceae bacterium HFYG-1003]